MISTTRTDDDRPVPPKRSSSSSSIIDERRARFEQQQTDSTSSLTTHQTDRPIVSRVGELKSAFESTTSGSIKDDLAKTRTPISTGITEQRRRIFEEQDQTNRRSVRTILFYFFKLHPSWVNNCLSFLTVCACEWGLLSLFLLYILIRTGGVKSIDSKDYDFVHHHLYSSSRKLHRQISYHRDEFIVSVVDDEHISYVFQSTYSFGDGFFFFVDIYKITSVYLFDLIVSDDRKRKTRIERQQLFTN